MSARHGRGPRFKSGSCSALLLLPRYQENIHMLGWPSRQRRGFSTKTPWSKSGRCQISLCLFISQRGPWAQYLFMYIRVKCQAASTQGPRLGKALTHHQKLQHRQQQQEGRRAEHPQSTPGGPKELVGAKMLAQITVQVAQKSILNAPGNTQTQRRGHSKSLQNGLGAIISPLFLPGFIACNVLQHCALNSRPEFTRVTEFGAKFTSNLKTIHSEQLEGSGVGENPHSPTVHTYSHHSPLSIAIFKTTRGAKNEVAAQTSWKNSDLTHDIASMQYQYIQIHSSTASRLRPRSQLSANCDKPLALLPSLKVQQIA
ncbi:Hypothetical_protein [Hexamita inflata]|uniref:Hypothetical_protein n=1 Tax=Hexamita inflata TaxID=28002 RepID=A0AA86URH0_9EUKA|nr:Hypothetical protein HINF_LOCUS21247 [Hexamita inflata]CAI9961902.1 Hypothetical protein HINF_LOCUS49547 [Hexamita inflata]